MSENRKDIELRSEKVRNIVGQVPPLLLRKGIMIITLVIVGVITGSYFMPYPEIIKTNAKIFTTPSCELIYAPYNGVILIENSSVKNVSKGQKLGQIQLKDSILILTSPIRGKLVVNSKDKNFVEQNDLIFAIIPDTITNSYCRAVISAEKIKKIKSGQQVKIKFPGNDTLIYGTVSELIPMPTDSLSTQYKIDITLPEQTSYCTSDILFQQGVASIQISDKSILNRFLESIGIK